MSSSTTGSPWRRDVIISAAVGFVTGACFVAFYVFGASSNGTGPSILGEPSPLKHTSLPRPVHQEPSNSYVAQEEGHHVIMCMIFTTPGEWMRKALAVKLTWAKRCDFHKFFYSKNDEFKLTGAYALDVPEGREHLTMKTLAALRISYEFYKGHVDWYVKADDDAFLVVENLRNILKDYDPSDGHYLGHRSTDFLAHGYNGGGATYSLSHEAARSIVEKGDMFPEACPVDGEIEDLDIGRCLEAFRIYPVDLRDEEGKLRFHPDHPIKLLLGDQSALSVYSYTKENYTFGHYQGIRVMSKSMVSFHYMDPAHIYMYDFLLYDLQRPLYQIKEEQTTDEKHKENAKEVNKEKATNVVTNG